MTTKTTLRYFTFNRVAFYRQISELQRRVNGTREYERGDGVVTFRKIMNVIFTTKKYYFY
jgi:hypothetical protein